MPKVTTLEVKIVAFMETRKEREGVKSELDKAMAKERKAQGELLEIMENQDLKSVRHEKFGLITSAVKIYGKIDDLDKAKEYFEEKGLDQELFKLALQKGRLNKLVNELIDEGKILPEGIGFSPIKYISVRKV